MPEVTCLSCSNEFESDSNPPLGPTCPSCGQPSRDTKMIRTDGGKDLEEVLENYRKGSDRGEELDKIAQEIGEVDILEGELQDKKKQSESFGYTGW